MAHFIDTITQKLDSLDWLELNVRTFSGNLQGVAKAEDAAWETAIEKAKKEGTITLVALTRGKIDGDIDQFVATEAKPALLDIHNEAVTNAKKTRQAIVDFIVDSFKSNS